MAKLPRLCDHSPMVSNRNHDQFNIDAILESLFAVPNSVSIDASFDGLIESRSTDSDPNDFIQRAIHISSVLLEAGKRSFRKRSSIHNASVWPLHPNLTMKVFSMLDTLSLSFAAATCSFFHKCAIDPLSHANIDLASSVPEIKVPKIKDAVVTTMLQRAGSSLQSIKLGVLLPDSNRRRYTCLLTSSCLSSLSENGGAAGSLLRRLHLYSIKRMGITALNASLSVCPSLVDLEIVNMNVRVSDTLESVSRYCRVLERFVFESDRDTGNGLKSPVCEEFVLNCPNINTFALKRCRVSGHDVRNVVKGFHELKYLDFTSSYLLTGTFLKNLGTKGGASKLKVLILRDCRTIDQVEVENFMEALLAGKFRLLRHLDIWNSISLPYTGDYTNRRYDVSFIPIKQLLKQRPNFCLIAESPNERCT